MLRKLPFMTNNALLVKRDDDIDPIPRRGNGHIREPYLIKVVSSADAGLIILMGEDVISRPGKDMTERIPDRLYTLSSLAAYFYGIIHDALFLLPG